jgi:hypothetical protein
MCCNISVDLQEDHSQCAGGLVTPVVQPQVRNRGTCEMQEGEEAECVKYSSCSPFVQMMVNLKKPLHPAVPSMVRSGFLCGIDDSTG